MVIRMKATRSKIGQRRSHKRITNPTLVKDKGSGALRRRHFADPITGVYRGKDIFKKAPTVKATPQKPTAKKTKK